MSLYVHPENQKILWNSINKTPLFQQLPNHVKEQFFKSVIQLFYEKYRHANLNSESLKQLNKDTILIMINKLKEMNENRQPHTSMMMSAPPPHPQSQSQSQSTPLLNNYMTPSFSTVNPNVMVSKDAEKGERQDVYSRMFQDRQKEYQIMNGKPTIPEVNFKENVEDEPISGDSMSKLIERHLKEREVEVGMAYYPSNIVPAPTLQVTPSPSNATSPHMSTISEYNASSTASAYNTNTTSTMNIISSTIPLLHNNNNNNNNNNNPNVPFTSSKTTSISVENVAPQVITQIEELTTMYKNLQTDIQELKNTFQTYFNKTNTPSPVSIQIPPSPSPPIPSFSVNTSIELLKEELKIDELSNSNSNEENRIHFEIREDSSKNI